MKSFRIQWPLLMVMLVMASVSNAQQIPVQPKLTAVNPNKWTQFGLNKLHVQDFGIGEQYADTCTTCLENGSFLGKANTTTGISFYMNRSEKFSFSTDFGIGYGYISRNNPEASDKQRGWSSSLRTDFYYHFYDSRLQVQPFLFGALQGSLKRGTAFVSAPVGLGARYMVFNNQGMITAQVGYGLGITQRMRNHVSYSWGLYIGIGKRKKDADKKETITAPDADADGVTDSLDACPFERGPRANKGCPVLDRDGDGMADKFDKCPEIKGPISNDGCPLNDRDKDGIDDANDRCPDIAGTPGGRGCPGDTLKIEVPRMEEKPFSTWRQDGNRFVSVSGDSIKYIIHFDFDKFILIQNSFDMLNEVVTFIKTNSNFECVLEGHTDLEGDTDYNLKLSERRVRNTKNYLMSYGVKPGRLTTNYYGKSRPVVSSFDENISWMNRRVEVMLVRKR
jgi:outer membrane protein OmpA-like peptidoglycan-associated protein